MPPVSALIGLKATLPSSLTQISWRNRGRDRAAEAGRDQRLGDRSRALGSGAVRLAEADAVALGVTDDAGLDDVGGEIGQRADDPARLDGGGDDAARIDALEAQARRARRRWSWKYHHGMPFCVLTTTVSGPSSGRSCGASAVRPCAFTPRNTTSAVPIALEIAGDLRLHLEIAVRADHAQAALLHRAQMRAAGEQDDVGAGLREPRADVAADGARAGDDDSHDAFCEYAFATTPRWILPVAVRGMASVM